MNKRHTVIKAFKTALKLKYYPASLLMTVCFTLNPEQSGVELQMLKLA